MSEFFKNSHIRFHKLDRYYGFGDQDVPDGTAVDGMAWKDWKSGGTLKENIIVHTHKPYREGDTLSDGTVFLCREIGDDGDGKKGYLTSVTVIKE